MEMITALGLGMTAGLSAFLPVFVLGSIAYFTDWVTLPESYQFLQSPWIFGIAGVLTIVELVADKIPAVDHVWDTMQTFLRPISGAVLALAAVGDVDPALLLFAGIFGGGLAGAMHTTKSTMRVLSTSTTGGLLNPFISLLEDVFAIAATLLALFSPMVMLVILIIFVIFLVWFMPKFWSYMVFRFSVIFSWLKWQFNRPKTDSTKSVQLYGLQEKKVSRFNESLDADEKLLAVLKGQVWLRRRRKSIWLVLTNRQLRIFVRGLFARSNWVYGPKSILNWHVRQGMIVQCDAQFEDQSLSFEFLKMATPHVNYLTQVIQGWKSPHTSTSV